MLDKTQAAAILNNIRENLDTGESNLHCVLALNWLLRQPEANDVMDETVKNQAREIWSELSAHGLVLEKPPLLFGLPEDFAENA